MTQASTDKPERRPPTTPAMDDPEQSQRFIDAARELGIEGTDEAYERALGRILPPRRADEPAQERKKAPKPRGKGRNKKGHG